MEDYATVPNKNVNSGVEDANNNIQSRSNDSGVEDANNYFQRPNNLEVKPMTCRFNPAPSMFLVFNTIISVFAIYLCFKCNNAVNIGELLVAIFCPVLYVLYRVAISPDLCGIRR
jgi:hypothetical protein